MGKKINQKKINNSKMKILKKYAKGGTPKYNEGGFTLTKADRETLKANKLNWFKDVPFGPGKYKWEDIFRSGSLSVSFNEKGEKVLNWRGSSMVIPQGSSLDKNLTPTMTSDYEQRMAEFEKKKNLSKKEVVKVGPIKTDKIKVDSKGNPIEDKKDDEKPKEEVKDNKNGRKQTPLSIKPVKVTTVESLAKSTKLPEEGRPKVEPTKVPEKEERREYIPQTQKKDNEEYTPQSMRMKKGGKVKLKKRKAMMGMIAKMAGGAAGGGAGSAMGKMKHGGVTKYKHGGSLKPVPEGSKGLKRLPKKVRNKMGYMEDGGMNKKSKGNRKFVKK